MNHYNFKSIRISKMRGEFNERITQNGFISALNSLCSIGTKGSKGGFLSVPI